MKTIRLHEKKQQQRRTCPGTKRFILNEKIAHANKLPSLLWKQFACSKKYNKGENTLGKNDLISAEKIAATFIDIECAG